MRFRSLLSAIALALALAQPAAAAFPDCVVVFNGSITAQTDTPAFNPVFPAGMLRISISALGASQTVTVQPFGFFPTGSLWKGLDSGAALAANGDYLYLVGANSAGSGQISDTWVPFPTQASRLRFLVFNANNATIVAEWCAYPSGYGS